METKKCTGCEKVLTTDKFSKAKYGKLGISARCKECCNKNYQENKGKAQKYREDNKIHISEYGKQYWAENKAIIAKRDKQWRAENKETIVEKRRQDYLKNRVAIVEHSRKYYQENKAEIAIKRLARWERDKKKEIKKQKAYTREHLEEFRVYNHNRRSLKQKLQSTFTVKQWEQVKLYFSNHCAYCGKEDILHQEHFVSLSKGGEYTHNNIIPACKSCNSSKRDRDFFEWYPKQRFYSKKREKFLLLHLGYKDNAQQLSIL